MEGGGQDSLSKFKYNAKSMIKGGPRHGEL